MYPFLPNFDWANQKYFNDVFDVFIKTKSHICTNAKEGIEEGTGSELSPLYQILVDPCSGPIFLLKLMTSTKVHQIDVVQAFT